MFKVLGRYVAIASIFSVALATLLNAQARVIRVVSPDGQPIPYANVIVQGGETRITDAKGEVSLGAGKSQTLTLNVRRIGFTPWFGKIDFPDTAAVLVVKLPGLSQNLSAVTVTGEKTIPSSLVLDGFYDRWLMRQKGVLSATFIGPEELEFRHPDKITGMLYGLSGVTVAQECVSPGHPCRRGGVVVKPGCGAMTVVIDGQQQWPAKGESVDLDMLLDASDVAAIEVYSRGGNMPVNFQFMDTICGVVAFWTGSRRP